MTQGLQDAHNRALEHLAALRRQHAEIVAASESSNADDEHDPEGATIAFEREQLRAQIGAARRRVADLESALAGVAAGTYGVCERCGGPIGGQRLEALPAVRRCIGCTRSSRA